ncbi:unnamed protein product [Nezara viridula]|uniref:Uncharacterized protein n=1 Tax=Nezara viridula TaxID=85310 RepID=A0A9P0HJ58_NEZVI|nr:unnamed protein product [Nezara viridula]
MTYNTARARCEGPGRKLENRLQGMTCLSGLRQRWPWRESLTERSFDRTNSKEGRLIMSMAVPFDAQHGFHYLSHL